MAEGTDSLTFRGIFVKSSSEKVTIEVDAKPSEQISVLRDRFAEKLFIDPSLLALVARGRKLDCNASVAADGLIDPTGQPATIYLCKLSLPPTPAPPPPHPSSPVAAPPISPPAPPKTATTPPQPVHTPQPGPQAAYPGDPVGEHERQCRICFDDTEDAITGRLISPCRCTGTMKYIHVSCLNRWRARSENDLAYYECSQCGYRYNIERVKWARLVLHENTSIAVSVVALLLMTLSLGYSLEWLELYKPVWEHIEFNPVQEFGTKVCTTKLCTEVCNRWFNWREKCTMNACQCQLLNTDGYFYGVISTGLL
eukprot:Sspe_Gene.88337::Locus_60369_Transcript_1_1_Confidence_1.000_Length_1008::g.88337::m.88337